MQLYTVMYTSSTDRLGNCVQVILLTECEEHMQTDSCSSVLQRLHDGLQQFGAEGLDDPLQQPGHSDNRLLIQEVCLVATQASCLTLKG